MPKYQMDPAMSRKLKTLAGLLEEINTIARKGGCNAHGRYLIKRRLANFSDSIGFLTRTDVGAELVRHGCFELGQKLRTPSEISKDIVTDLTQLQRALKKK